MNEEKDSPVSFEREKGRAAVFTASAFLLLVFELFYFSDVLFPEKRKAPPDKKDAAVYVLALDWDGDGRIGIRDGIYFDYGGDGFPERTPWVDASDLFLVRDANANGKIDDGEEIFGSRTVTADGSARASGFEALALADANGDRVLDAEDPLFSELMLWRDLNQNGVSEAAELAKLEEWGVGELNFEEAPSKAFFVKNNGIKGRMEEKELMPDFADTLEPETGPLPEEILRLPNLGHSGTVPSLHAAMFSDKSGRLKSLLERYAAENDPVERDALLTDLIYAWAGVSDINPESRASKEGNAIGDARKLAVLEKYLGRPYLGTWNGRDRDPNPHAKAAAHLLNAFENLKEYVDGALGGKTHYAKYLDAINIEWDAEKTEWKTNVSKALELLEKDYVSAPDKELFLRGLVRSLSVHGRLGKSALEDLQRPNADGSESAFKRDLRKALEDVPPGNEKKINP